MSFGNKGNKEDGMEEPLVKNRDTGEKRGIGGVVFPADHAKIPISAFLNPKNPEKVDIEASISSCGRQSLDSDASIVVVTTAGGGGGSGMGDPHRALKEVIAGSICLGLLVTVALAFLGGSYSLNHWVDYRNGNGVARYKGWCAVPYNYGKEIDIEELLSAENAQAQLRNGAPFFFHERFTLDAGEDDFQSEIEVPDFKGGRHGKFLHDFRKNLTAIIDMTGGRCFIMPLDTKHIMRPSSLIDVLKQMDRGHYQVDTKLVRETMRVTWPPMQNREPLGSYIAASCHNKDTFWLEKLTPATAAAVVEGLNARDEALRYQTIFKREAGNGPKEEKADKVLKFAEFAGHNVLEFDILGLDSA